MTETSEEEKAHEPECECEDCAKQRVLARRRCFGLGSSTIPLPASRDEK